MRIFFKFSQYLSIFPALPSHDYIIRRNTLHSSCCCLVKQSYFWMTVETWRRRRLLLWTKFLLLSSTSYTSRGPQNRAIRWFPVIYQPEMFKVNHGETDKTSPEHSSPAESWDGEEDHKLQGPALNESSPPSGTQSHPVQPKVTVPIQKRRRVTRACDECRRKKIKCDGRSPVKPHQSFYWRIKMLISENTVYALYRLQLW